MRKILFTVMNVLFLNILSFCQDVVVSTPYSNSLYYGIRNPLNVYYANTSCKQIRIIANKGFLEGSGCNYYYLPDALGEVSFYTYIRNKIIDTITIKILNVDDFIVKFNRPKEEFNPIFDSLIVSSKTLNDIGVKYEISSFEVYCYRNDSLLFSAKNNGKTFSNAIVEKINSTWVNDIIKIRKIIIDFGVLKQEISTVLYCKIH